MRTIVVGGGIAGLVAAWHLARSGARPQLFEARGYTGGLVAGLPVPGTSIVADIGAESFATRGGHTARLIADLGLDCAPAAGRSWVLSGDGRALPIPSGILGIPGEIDDDVAAALTKTELDRAREDLTMGPDAGSDCLDLASLVTARLGRAVLEKLVAPVAGGIHSAPPSQLSVDVVAPGLRAALREHGSLLRAVQALRGLPSPPPVVEQVVGGMHLLAAALARDIVAAGGQIYTRTGVIGLRRGDAEVQPQPDAQDPNTTGLQPQPDAQDPKTAGVQPQPDGQESNDADAPSPNIGRKHTNAAGREPGGAGWVLDVAPMNSPRGPELQVAGPSHTLVADRVVLACSGRQALDLLAEAIGVEPWQLPAGAPIAHLTMLLRAPALDAAPRGSGMLAAPGAPVSAKAFTHMSEKWPWLGQALRAELGASHHLVRMSYGRHDEPYPCPTVAGAVADLARMTGVEVAEEAVLAHRLIRWDGTLAPPTPAHRAASRELAARIAEIPSLAVTGAWLAGSGIAAIVPHARAAAEKVCPAARGARPAAEPNLPAAQPANRTPESATCMAQPAARTPKPVTRTPKPVTRTPEPTPGTPEHNAPTERQCRCGTEKAHDA